MKTIKSLRCGIYGRNILFMFFCGFLFLNALSRISAQTVIGGLTPDPSAMLDVQSSQKGVLFPRMTTAERDAITNAAPGLIIFNTTENRVQLYMGSSGNNYWWNMALEPLGTIASLDCAGAILSSEVFFDQPLIGITVSVPYTGGNGGAHLGQIVNSTGVTGLTATLLAGSFASGSGSLIYTITGTPSVSGIASFSLNIGGQNCSFNLAIQGSISTLNCTSAVSSGALLIGNDATGVSVSVPYTGGSGGVHVGQSITSTGVMGLTANLMPGIFAIGNGNLIYNITGTPPSLGTAAFALNIGGQNCTLSLPVQVLGTITALDCNAAIRKGEMQPNFQASGVSIILPYTGGNGGAYPAQSVSSTGVLGYTAILSSGNFTSSSGNLTYTIEGTAITAGTATFAFSIGGQSCSLDLVVRKCEALLAGNQSRVFGCYNLGAYNTRVSPTEPSWENHGGYWQWGRKDMAVAGPVGPAANQTNETGPANWNTNLASNDAWLDGSKTPDDPCPVGFRVPSRTQWEEVVANNTRTDASGSTWTNSSTHYTTGKTFGSELMLPIAGDRNSNGGGLLTRGFDGNYWTSTFFNASDSYYFYIRLANVRTDVNAIRTSGFSVRCISIQ